MGPVFRARLHRLLRGQRGQNLVEYALLTFWMLAGGAVAVTKFGPAIVTALNDYIHSYYYVLSLPFP